MRKAILIAVVTVAAVLFAAAGAWAAGTEYRALTEPEVVSPGAAPVELGSLYVRVELLKAGEHSALVSLPEGCSVVRPAAMHAMESEMVTMDFATTAKANEFLMSMEVGAPVKAATFVIPITAGLAGVEDGAIPLMITGLGGQLTSAAVTVAKAVPGGVKASVNETPVIGEAGSSGGQIGILLSEKSPGALKAGVRSLEMTLPVGFSWAGSPSVEVLKRGGYSVTARKDPDNSRILVADVNMTGVRSQGTFRINADIGVEAVEAEFGEVTVAFTGATKVDPAALPVARYQDYGAEFTVRSVSDVFSGRLSQNTGDLVLTETAADSLVSGRTIILSLPDGAKWASFGAVEGVGGLGVTGAPDVLNDGQALRYAVSRTKGNQPGKLYFKDMKADIALDFTGDLMVGVTGSAGVTGNVKAAKVLSPVTAEAVQPRLAIGKQDQTAGNIVISEAKAGALLRGKSLRLEFPRGISVSGAAVSVAGGNLDINETGAAFKDNALIIPIRTQSTSPSKIEISGLTYTLDRYVQAGPIVIDISGTAVNQVNDKAALAGVTRGYAIGAHGVFPGANSAGRVANAIATAGTADAPVQFVIGQSSYAVFGVAQKMDVAPYLQDGRTFLPLRYIGLSLGVEAEDIEWDGQIATLTKGDTVVKAAVNTKSIEVTGEVRVIDAAPEMAPPGRIMLPYRAVAEAFGAQVDWDAATKTVLMTL